MKTFCAAVLLGLASTMVSRASMINVGSKIQEVSVTMKALGYSEGGLAVEHADQIRKILGESEKEEKDLENLKIWQVDQGFLVVSYVVSTGIVTNLSFNLHDERPKGLRREFRFSVVSFDPQTAELTIQTTRK